MRELTKNPDRSVTGNAFGGILGFLLPFVFVPFLTLFLAILDLERVNRRKKRCRRWRNCVIFSHWESNLASKQDGIIGLFYVLLTWSIFGLHASCSSRYRPLWPSRWSNSRRRVPWWQLEKSDWLSFSRSMSLMRISRFPGSSGWRRSSWDAEPPKRWPHSLIMIFDRNQILAACSISIRPNLWASQRLNHII